MCQYNKRVCILLSLLIILSGCQTSTLFTVPPPKTAGLSVANQNYIKLKEALPLYENAVAYPWQPIPANIKFQAGKKNAAVALLRQRLRATHDLTISSDLGDNVYDVALIEAVKIFQKRHGLKPDGIIGEETRQQLNISPQQRLHQIQVNMQRWATLSQELSNHYIMVNVPAYQLEVVENGKKVLEMKTIVGRPSRPTPELTSTVTRVVFNPYWNVPHKLAQKDILPKLLEDPDYLDDMHIKILDKQEDNAKMVDQEDVDWQDAEDNGFKYHFRQDPGLDNALGSVKFEFTNSEDVYLHDTPAKNLFGQDKRDFSSGCIRLEKPFDLVTYLMKDNPQWNEERLQMLLTSGKTSYVKAATPTPIIITYITAWVDENGLVEFRDDLYGHDE